MGVSPYNEQWRGLSNTLYHAIPSRTRNSLNPSQTSYRIPPKRETPRIASLIIRHCEEVAWKARMLQTWGIPQCIYFSSPPTTQYLCHFATRLQSRVWRICGLIWSATWSTVSNSKLFMHAQSTISNFFAYHPSSVDDASMTNQWIAFL